MRRLYSIVFSGLLAILLLDACHSVPKQARYIPKDASVVIGVNTGAMSKKVAWSMITGSKLLDNLKEKAPGSKGADALNDISNAGIDWMNTLYFYARPDQRFDNHAKMSVVIPLDDAAKWEAFIKKTFPEAKITKVKDRSEAMLGKKMYAAWTSDVLMVMNAIVIEVPAPAQPAQEVVAGGPTADTVTIAKADTVVVAAAPVTSDTSTMRIADTLVASAFPDAAVDESFTPSMITKVDQAATIAEMDSSFNLSKENSIAGNDRFENLEKAGHDITIFVAYDALMDNAAMRNQMGSMSMMLNSSLWKNSAMATGVDFVDGKITADMLYYPSDSMHAVVMEMGKDDVSKDMLSRIPAEKLNMALGYHLSPEALKMILDKMGLTGMANLALMQKGLSVDDILGAFTGDMTLSVNDLKMEKGVADTSMPADMRMPASDMPKLNVVYAIKLKDRKKLDKLLGLLQSEMGIAPSAPNKYSFPIGQDSVTALLDDNYIVVSNKIAVAQAFMAGKGSTPELVKKEISSHPYGMVMDIQSLASVVPSDIGGNNKDSAILTDARNLFSTISMNGGDFKHNASTFHMELRFVNEKENSLMQLINFAQRIAAAQQKPVVVMR